MGASKIAAIYNFAINFGTAASHDGLRSAIADAEAKQQQRFNKPKHTAANKKCANGTCAKCFLKERFARHNSYQHLDDEGNGESTPCLVILHHRLTWIADEFGDW